MKYIAAFIQIARKLIEWIFSSKGNVAKMEINASKTAGGDISTVTRYINFEIVERRKGGERW